MIYRELVFLIKFMSNFHIQGEKSNIFLFSNPRSGSTWLMDTIAAQPGFKYFDEPLNIRREDVKKTGMFHNWDTIMPDRRNDQKIIEYLKKLEANKIKFMNPPPIVRRNYRILTNRIIFKIHEIQHLINVIKDELKGKIVYLIRHPLSTVISRNVFPRLEYFINSKYYRENLLSKEQIKIVRKIFENGDKIQKGVLSWCFENIVPLNYLDKKDWLFITYEELVINPNDSCELLYKKLELDDLNKLEKSIKRPASNIKLSTKETVDILLDRSNLRRKSMIIKKWRNSVSKEEENKAFDIISLFGIDIYSKRRFIAKKKYLNFSDTESLSSG